jgi:hypothetical protein
MKGKLTVHSKVSLHEYKVCDTALAKVTQVLHDHAGAESTTGETIICKQKDCFGATCPSTRKYRK